ncbi:hypothetical protein M0R45_003389 [Rubus argutus]|uniref:Uncharacterized protein n=1 Tax=Rubus argutus TaxID=59490 RepID=A0AAW1YFC3_RUBAR
MNGKAGQSPSDFRDLFEEMNTQSGYASGLSLGSRSSASAWEGPVGHGVVLWIRLLSSESVSVVVASAFLDNRSCDAL